MLATFSLPTYLYSFYRLGRVWDTGVRSLGIFDGTGDHLLSTTSSSTPFATHATVLLWPQSYVPCDDHLFGLLYSVFLFPCFLLFFFAFLRCPVRSPS